ncbi:MAG TPA: hypothetical protein VKE96_02650 [Vicinamibacterales bacterium]|nr:hypothetical protein [Vicinamibacterales bacterium]
MRNDARPIGEANPHAISDHPHDDARESVTHDRQSHVVNEGATEDAGPDDEELDPVMPPRDSALKDG